MEFQRRQVRELEAAYGELVNNLSQLTSTCLIPWTRTPRFFQLLQHYRILTQVAITLQLENASLQQANETYINVARHVSHIVSANTVQYVSRPLPMTELQRVLRVARTHVLEFLSNSSKLTTGRSSMGWTDQGQIVNGELSFSLGKQFPFSASQLLQRSWAILSSPSRYVKLYSPSVAPQLHLLQHIDDDTLLYYTKLEVADHEAALQSVYILHRERYEHGFLVLIHSIDPQHIDFDTGGFNNILNDVSQRIQGNLQPSRWVKKLFVWLVFDEQSLSTCWFQLCGVSKQIWATEVLMIAMRWQIQVVGHELLLR